MSRNFFPVFFYGSYPSGLLIHQQKIFFAYALDFAEIIEWNVQKTPWCYYNTAESDAAASSSVVSLAPGCKKLLFLFLNVLFSNLKLQCHQIFETVFFMIHTYKNTRIMGLHFFMNRFKVVKIFLGDFLSFTKIMMTPRCHGCCLVKLRGVINTEEFCKIPQNQSNFFVNTSNCF